MNLAQVWLQAQYMINDVTSAFAWARISRETHTALGMFASCCRDGDRREFNVITIARERRKWRLFSGLHCNTLRKNMSGCHKRFSSSRMISRGFTRLHCSVALCSTESKAKKSRNSKRVFLLFYFCSKMSLFCVVSTFF